MSGKRPISIKGQGLVEYALILVLVAVVVIIVLAIFGPAVGSAFSSIMDPFGEGIGQGPADPDDPDPGVGPPRDCYSTILIPIMVGAMGVATAMSQYIPDRWMEKFSLPIPKSHNGLN